MDEAGVPYDVFVSYACGRPVGEWVRELFGRPFQSWVEGSEGKPRVFLDFKAIQAGNEIPAVIAEAIQTSQIFVPILAPPYFYSRWCVSELALFEQVLDERRRLKKKKDVAIGAVCPVLFHPCGKLSEPYRNIHTVDFTKYAISHSVRAFRTTERHVEFEKVVKAFAASVVGQLSKRAGPRAVRAKPFPLRPAQPRPPAKQGRMK